MYKHVTQAHALRRDSVNKPEDETLPDLERMERKLGDKSRLFLSQVYDDGYDPEAPPKKAVKPTASKDKSSVKTVDLAVDMGREVDNGTVSKLTVDTMKNWCRTQGISVTNKKKAELVQIITEQFK